MLYLTRWYPDPPVNGASLRDRALIGSLIDAGHEVALVSLVEGSQPDLGSPWSQRLARIETAPYPGFVPSSWSAITGFVSMRPRLLASTYRTSILDLIQRVVTDEQPDVCVAWGLQMATYATRINVPFVYELAEFAPFIETPHGHGLGTVRQRLSHHKQRRYAQQMLRSAAAVISPSETEAANALRLVPNLERVVIVPNGVAEPPTDIIRNEDRYRLVYSGSVLYQPNRDAVDWFSSRILPLVRAQVPEAHLVVTGGIDGTERRYEAVTYSGLLADPRPMIAGSAICVVPLRAGGGTRLKVLEALSLGTAVVSTSKGVEGLHLEPLSEVLVADGETDFAEAVVELLRDPARQTRLTERGRNRVMHEYLWSVLTPSFVSAVEVSALR